MNTSVYLVSGGLLVKTTTQKLPLCLFICVVFCVKIKNKKINLADLVPAYRVVFTLLLAEVFLLILSNNPTLKSWSVHLICHL